MKNRWLARVCGIEIGLAGYERGSGAFGIKSCQKIRMCEGDMADFKFDRNELRDRHGSKVAVIDGKYIRDSHGSRMGEIDGKYFKDSHGARLGEFDGSYVRDSHGSRIATIGDVKKSIDGVGGASMVAMWLFFVR